VIFKRHGATINIEFCELKFPILHCFAISLLSIFHYSTYEKKFREYIMVLYQDLTVYACTERDKMEIVNYLIFQVLRAAGINIMFLWNVTLCSLVEKYRIFRNNLLLPLQGSNVDLKEAEIRFPRNVLYMCLTTQYHVLNKLFNKKF
jgi:hypothetical protein